MLYIFNIHKFYAVKTKKNCIFGKIFESVQVKMFLFNQSHMGSDFDVQRAY